MSPLGYYTLDADGKPQPCDDVLEWARWLESDERILRQTRMRLPDQRVMLASTVFLGIDHAFMGGPPVLWETMVFDAPDGEERGRRHCSAEAALEYHKQVERELMMTFAATLSDVFVSLRGAR